MNDTYIYVDSDSSLESLVERIRPYRRIAIDMEADSFHHYYEKVCLIQLAAGDDIYLVDPLANLQVAKLLDALSEKVLIFHDGGYDLRMMRSSFSFRPRTEVFDTMLAAQLLGYREFGLAAMLDRFFDMKMVKTHQKANWSKRPLDKRLLDYAGDDVRFLETLVEILAGKLKELGRDGWHQESCRWMVEATGMDKARPDTDKEWRIKGTRQLDRRQLAYARQIWRWREHEAKRADLPPFKILVNHQLLELATWAQCNPGKSLAQGPKLPRNCTGRRNGALRKAIEKAHTLGESSLPRIPRPTRSNPPSAECKKLAELLRQECHRIANELDIEPFVLAPRATIAVVARNRPDTIDTMMACGPMMQWQAELLLPIFSKHF